MSLKITSIGWQNAHPPCNHLKITINDNGDVHDIPWSLTEDQILEMAQGIREYLGLPVGMEAEALCILWATVMIKKRGFTAVQCTNVELDPA